MTYLPSSMSHATLASRQYSFGTVGTSTIGNPNSWGVQVALRSLGALRMVRNGGQPGQNQDYILNRMRNAVLVGNPAIVAISSTRNDDLGGGIAATQAKQMRIVRQLRQAGILVSVATEPFSVAADGSDTSLNTNIAVINAWIRANPWVSDPGVMIFDLADVNFTRSGTLKVPAIATTGSPAVGSASFAVASATGLQIGMGVWGAAGSLLGGSPTKITNISGTTITVSGNVTTGAGTNVPLLFSTVMQDAVHQSTYGGSLVADAYLLALRSVGWLPRDTLKMAPYSPAFSADPTSANNVFDLGNMVANGGMTGTVTAGVAAGLNTNYTGTGQAVAVVADANFDSGMAQQITLSPGAAAGLIQTSAPVAASALPGLIRKARGRKVAARMKVFVSGLQAAGSSNTVGGSTVTFKFNFLNATGAVQPPVPISTDLNATANAAAPLNFPGVDFEGYLVLYGEAYMPPGTTYPQFFVSTSAISATAPGNVVIRFGDLAIYDMDDPFRPALQTRNVDVVAVSLTLDAGYDLIRGNATSAAVVLTLPAAATCPGRSYTLAKTDSSANPVQFLPAGSELLAGANAAKGVSAQFSTLTVTSNGAGWDVTGSYGT